MFILSFFIIASNWENSGLLWQQSSLDSLLFDMQVSQLEQLKGTLLWQHLHEELKEWQQEVVQVSWQALCAIWTELAQLMTKSLKAACLEVNKEGVALQGYASPQEWSCKKSPTISSLSSFRIKNGLC